MDVLRSVALFGGAALFEIGGAWLIWQGVREQDVTGALLCLAGVAVIMYAPRTAG